ncbi:hypothetical protein [Bremerella sp. P1]|uniref:hypothetical protein n=1 Tax=Bremerella sp. P1 TaxID=3026424 RepID=UPI002368C713|nr:hypothetical protein [Bremerella sp. P1]WDI41049.1 hypothetical protein PSR63_21510 [Bremerella sp. P1]
MTYPTIVQLSIAISLSLPILGCSGEQTTAVPISGTVTVEGDPVEKGSITFISVSGNVPSAGAVILDGRYTAKVEPGDKKIMVLGSKVIGQEPEFEDDPNSSMRDVMKTTTHPNYNAKHLTPLATTIDKPTDDLNFVLTRDGKGD